MAVFSLLSGEGRSELGRRRLEFTLRDPGVLDRRASLAKAITPEDGCCILYSNGSRDAEKLAELSCRRDPTTTGGGSGNYRSYFLSHGPYSSGIRANPSFKISGRLPLWLYARQRSRGCRGFGEGRKASLCVLYQYVTSGRKSPGSGHCGGESSTGARQSNGSGRFSQSCRTRWTFTERISRQRVVSSSGTLGDAVLPRGKTSRDCFHF